MLVEIPLYGGAASMLTEEEVRNAARDLLVGKARAELMKLNHARMRVEAAIFESNRDTAVDEAEEERATPPERADYQTALESSVAEFEMVVVTLGKIVEGLQSLEAARSARKAVL